MNLIIVDQDQLINSGLADKIVRQIGYVSLDDLKITAKRKKILKRINEIAERHIYDICIMN